MKEVTPSLSSDLLIIRGFHHRGITVVMQIDFINKKATMVEAHDEYGNKTKDFKPKKWLFQDRSLDYMGGWLLILDAMKNAVVETAKLLQEAEDRDQDKFLEIFVDTNKALKKGQK